MRLRGEKMKKEKNRNKLKIINYEIMIKLKLKNIIKKFSYYPKIRVNSLKTSTIYACF